MQERRKKHIFPDLIFSKFFWVFCLLVFIIIILRLAKGTIKNNRVNTEIKQLEQEISRLQTQNQDFEQLVKYLNSDIFIEQEAKLKMGLKKEGENLVVIPNAELSVNKNENKQNQNNPNPVKWWNYFFH
jgi:cell division protein FtsL